MNTLFDRFGRLHAWVYRHHGRLGRRFAWIPCLVLASTGRKSGTRRESVLVYADDGDETYPAAARVVDADDPDYARLWKLVNSINSNRYDAYQAKTTRPIPMVAVERRTADG